MLCLFYIAHAVSIAPDHNIDRPSLGLLRVPEHKLSIASEAQTVDYTDTVSLATSTGGYRSYIQAIIIPDKRMALCLRL